MLTADAIKAAVFCIDNPSVSHTSKQYRVIVTALLCEVDSLKRINRDLQREFAPVPGMVRVKVHDRFTD